jgi:hypothetical protein
VRVDRPAGTLRNKFIRTVAQTHCSTSWRLLPHIPPDAPDRFDVARGALPETIYGSDLILDTLDEEGEHESDALDARVASETGLSAKTVRNQRTELKNEGLVKPVPEKDDRGTVVRWKVVRTAAPRSAKGGAR